MSVDFLPPIAPVAAPAWPSVEPLAASVSTRTGFASFVSDGLAQVDRGLQTSQFDLQRLAAGDVSGLHQVMVRLEESRLSMQLVLQVRNRLLESYQELMRMQV